MYEGRLRCILDRIGGMGGQLVENWGGHAGRHRVLAELAAIAWRAIAESGIFPPFLSCVQP